MLLKCINIKSYPAYKVRQPSTVNRQLPSLAILSTPSQKAEIGHSRAFAGHELIFAENLETFVHLKADAYLDLAFEPDLFVDFNRAPGTVSAGISGTGTKIPGEGGGISGRSTGISGAGAPISGEDNTITAADKEFFGADTGIRGTGGKIPGEGGAITGVDAETAEGSPEVSGAESRMPAEDNANSGVSTATPGTGTQIPGEGNREEGTGAHISGTDIKKPRRPEVRLLPTAVLRRIELLSRLLPSPVFVNSVILPLTDLHPDFIRINGWPGYLESSLIEAAAHEHSKENARGIFGENILFVKDVPGLVNPRILSMIINEAFYTLRAGISTRQEMDIAMKLGTGYPLGPFEWAEKIGRNRVAALLTALGKEDLLYAVAEGMGEG